MMKYAPFNRFMLAESPSLCSLALELGLLHTLASGTLVLHTVDFHDIGNNYNPANGRFTAPVAGVYYLGAQAISGSATTNSEQNLKVQKNGVGVCDAQG